MSAVQLCLGASGGGLALGAEGLLAALLRAHSPEDESTEHPLDQADCDDIAASLRGDGDAYARLVSRHQGKVASILWRFTRDSHRLEELVQDVFVQAYVGLQGFKGKAPFSRWLRRIAIRVGYRHWKDLERRREDVPLDDLGDIASQPEDTAPDRAGEILHGLLAKLPPRDRLVLTLIYVDELSVAETAELTGWSRVMVKVQAHRARGKLKRIAERELVRG